MDITFSNVVESDLKIIAGLFGSHCDALAPEIARNWRERFGQDLIAGYE